MLVGRAAVPWQQDLQQDTGVSWNNRDCDVAETQPGRIQLPTTLRVHQDLVFELPHRLWQYIADAPLDNDSEHAHPGPVSHHMIEQGVPTASGLRRLQLHKRAVQSSPTRSWTRPRSACRACISATYAPTSRDITLLSDFRKHKPTHEAPECAFKPTTTCLATLKHLAVQSSPHRAGPSQQSTEPMIPQYMCMLKQTLNPHLTSEQHSSHPTHTGPHKTPSQSLHCCAEFPHTELDQTTQRLRGLHFCICTCWLRPPLLSSLSEASLLHI